MCPFHYAGFPARCTCPGEPPEVLDRRITPDGTLIEVLVGADTTVTVRAYPDGMVSWVVSKA